MLSVEEYIARRKKEDKLNEFDIEARTQNMKLCVDYVFEYFNNYLNITEAEEKTILHDEKLEKYRKQLQDYETDVREWLVSMNDQHGKQLHRHIGNILKENELFFLYDLESEFRSVSYDCYSKLIKKLPFLKDHAEMLFQFIKNYHSVESQRGMHVENPIITEEINDWIDHTWTKHHVNLFLFAENWLLRFDDNEESWPIAHRIKSKYNFRKYDYDYRQKSNLFNLDSLYRKMPKKPFIRGKKQEFEILFMYTWVHNIDGEQEYWDEYLQKVLPFLKN